MPESHAVLPHRSPTLIKSPGSGSRLTAPILAKGRPSPKLDITMTILDARSKGKNKERAPSAGGNGGGSGMVLSMDMVSTSYYAVYVQV